MITRVVQGSFKAYSSTTSITLDLPLGESEIPFLPLCSFNYTPSSGSFRATGVALVTDPEFQHQIELSYSVAPSGSFVSVHFYLVWLDEDPALIDYAGVNGF